MTVSSNAEQRRRQPQQGDDNHDGDPVTLTFTTTLTTISGTQTETFVRVLKPMTNPAVSSASISSSSSSSTSSFSTIRTSSMTASTVAASASSSNGPSAAADGGFNPSEAELAGAVISAVVLSGAICLLLLFTFLRRRAMLEKETLRQGVLANELEANPLSGAENSLRSSRSASFDAAPCEEERDTQMRKAESRMSTLQKSRSPSLRSQPPPFCSSPPSPSSTGDNGQQDDGPANRENEEILWLKKEVERLKLQQRWMLDDFGVVAPPDYCLEGV